MTSQRVLVVTAHPDDPEFHFGATIAMLTSADAEVSYLICTNGEQGIKNDADSTDEEVSSIRCTEQRNAALVLGVRHITFLGMRDGQLEANLDLRRGITAEIRRVRPSLVLTHYPYWVLDIPLEASHPDHLAVGEATLAAIYPDASNRRAFPELLGEGLDAHRVAEVWVPGYERPNHYIDATPFLHQKIEAIRCHRSQMADDGLPEWIYAWMREIGRKPGYEYAESFRRIQI